jgi:hypothetical protein
MAGNHFSASPDFQYSLNPKVVAGFTDCTFLLEKISIIERVDNE